jgi:hypothetical protein
MFSDEGGLYLVTPGHRTPRLVSSDPVAAIDPPGPGDYLFTIRFDPSGIATCGATTEFDYQVLPVRASSHAMQVDMSDLVWAWTSADPAQPGVWIAGLDAERYQIYSGPAAFPAWDPFPPANLDSFLLFFAEDGTGGYNIYRATFDDNYRDYDLSLVNTIAAPLYNIVWLGAR